MRRTWPLYALGTLCFLIVVQASLAKSIKYDLTDYIVPDIRAGDYLDYESDSGTESRSYFVAVYPWKKGYEVHYLNTVDGTESSRTSRHVIPGKKILMGTTFAQNIELSLPKPKKFLKCRMSIGKPQRYRMKGRAFVSGVPQGKFKIQGTWTFFGFEKLETPSWTFENVAKLVHQQTITVKDKVLGGTLEIHQTATFWYHPGWGPVGQRSSSQIYVDGALDTDTGSVEAWFVGGRINGNTVPDDPSPPPPPPPPPEDYYFTLYNRTEGYLKNVNIGANYVGQMNPDGSYTVKYPGKPSSIRITAESGSDFGWRLLWDSIYYPGSLSVESKNLVVDGDYFSLWVTNNSIYYTLDTIVFDSGLIDQQTYSIYHAPDYGTRIWYGFYPAWSNNSVYIFSGTRYWYIDPLPSPKAQNAYGAKHFTFIVN